MNAPPTHKQRLLHRAHGHPTARHKRYGHGPVEENEAPGGARLQRVYEDCENEDKYPRRYHFPHRNQLVEPAVCIPLTVHAEKQEKAKPVDGQCGNGHKHPGRFRVLRAEPFPLKPAHVEEYAGNTERQKIGQKQGYEFGSARHDA